MTIVNNLLKLLKTWMEPFGEEGTKPPKDYDDNII